MKQQFFVGDVVRLNQLGLEVGNKVMQDANHDLWSSKYILMLKSGGTAIVSKPPSLLDSKVWLEDNAFFVSPEHLEVVERAWQKNTGKQPVNNDVEVEIRMQNQECDLLWAGDLNWGLYGMSDDVVEWRIADSGSSNKEQPEAVPTSHIALGNELVQVGEPYMKVWCDTCQGTGEIDETLGGESFSGRHTPCPDCDGKGWWERVIADSVDNAPVQKDLVNSPKHYAFFDGVEAIEIIASSMSVEAFRGYCMGCNLKYRLRAGKKDDLQQDISKAEKYKELFENYKHLCQVK